MKPTGLYIHVPYCGRRCLYCDFYSGGARVAKWRQFVGSVIEELRRRRRELTVAPSTIYIGGGTPSLMPEDYFGDLVKGVKDIFTEGLEVEEFTVEVNPEDVGDAKCKVWRECGVNRVSMGVQSFNDGELLRVGRRHDAAKAVSSYCKLREYFGNVSIDLMFGLPGQTMQTWRESVETAIGLHPEHISAYSLMFEPGTSMTLLREQGRMAFPSEEECVEMWRHLSSRLADSGYRQYEISNYAVPGRESVHNSRYWTQNAYLGLGPSAHSYDGHRTRRWNPRDIEGYLDAFGRGNGFSGQCGYIYKEEILTDEELKEEMILTRMRTREGLDVAGFRERFGAEAAERLLRNGEKEIRRGLLDRIGDMLRLTPEGVMLSDDVILSLSM